MDKIERDTEDSNTQLGDIEMHSVVHMSVFQVYNENVNDLLSSNVNANRQIR